jgi:hypothetical protein
VNKVQRAACRPHLCFVVSSHCPNATGAPGIRAAGAEDKFRDYGHGPDQGMLYEHSLQEEGKTLIAVRLNFPQQAGFKFLPFSNDNNGVFVLPLVVRNFPCPVRSDLALTLAQSESESGSIKIKNDCQSSEDMSVESAADAAKRTAESQAGGAGDDGARQKSESVFEHGQSICVMLNVKSWLGATGKPVMG